MSEEKTTETAQTDSAQFQQAKQLLHFATPEARGLVGLAAALSMISFLLWDWRVVLLGGVGMLVFVVLYKIVQGLDVPIPKTMQYAFYWFVFILLVVLCLLLLGSLFSQGLLPLHEWVMPQTSSP